MSRNRVPSTEDVRNAAESSHDWWRYRDDPHAFSTWLAQVKADAWDEGHNTPPETVPSRENEPPVGAWVKDRFGGTSFRQPGGWGEPGMMPFGRWEVMWEHRGPYTLCGPWGAEYRGSANPHRKTEEDARE